VKKVEGQRAAAWTRIFMHFGAQIASFCTLYFVPKPVLYCFLGMIVRLKRTGASEHLQPLQIENFQAVWNISPYDNSAFLMLF
jgi:hypothetical protein